MKPVVIAWFKSVKCFTVNIGKIKRNKKLKIFLLSPHDTVVTFYIHLIKAIIRSTHMILWKIKKYIFLDTSMSNILKLKLCSALALLFKFSEQEFSVFLKINFLQH